MHQVTSNVKNTLNRSPNVDVLSPSYDARATEADGVIIEGQKSLEPPHSYHGGYKLKEGDSILVDRDDRIAVRVLEIESDGVIVCREPLFGRHHWTERDLGNQSFRSMSWSQVVSSDEVQEALEEQEGRI